MRQPVDHVNQIGGDADAPRDDLLEGCVLGLFVRHPGATLRDLA